MKILAVDLGNFNVKTSEGVIFSSKLTTETQLDRESEDILEFDGIEYCIGKGRYDYEYDKTKKNYMPLLLTAISKSIKKSDLQGQINLVIGLPLAQMAKKDDILYVLSNNKFKFKFNSDDYSVKIDNVAVIPEGFASFYTLPKHVRDNRTLVIDIGGRTVNATSFVNSKNEKSLTLPTGMINFYQTIVNKENAKGKNITIEEVENLIEENRIFDIEQEKTDFIKGIVNDLKLNFDTSLYEVFFTGGGSLVLKDIITRKIRRANLIDNSLFSNVNGNKAIAEAKWRKMLND